MGNIKSGFRALQDEIACVEILRYADIGYVSEFHCGWSIGKTMDMGRNNLPWVLRNVGKGCRLGCELTKFRCCNDISSCSMDQSSKERKEFILAIESDQKKGFLGAEVGNQSHWNQIPSHLGELVFPTGDIWKYLETSLAVTNVTNAPALVDCSEEESYNVQQSFLPSKELYFPK